MTRNTGARMVLFVALVSISAACGRVSSAVRTSVGSPVPSPTPTPPASSAPDTLVTELPDANIVQEFDFDASYLVALSFDEYVQTTSAEASARGVSTSLFDPRSIGGDWSFKFTGAAGVAITNDVTIYASLTRFDPVEELALLKRLGWSPTLITVKGAAGMCVLDPRLDALFLQCGYGGETVLTAGKPGVTRERVVAVAEAALEHPVPIGTVGGVAHLPATYEPDAALSALDPFPLPSAPLGPNEQSFSTSADIFVAVSAVLHSLGMYIQGYDIGQDPNLTRFFFDGSMFLAVGNDYAVAQSLGGQPLDTLKVAADRINQTSATTGIRATLPAVLSNTPCMFVASPQRSTLECSATGVNLQIISYGSPDQAHDLARMNQLISIAQTLLAKPLALPR